ncbi:MAG: TldD/PmbA family protein [Nitrospirae bacterium]|nr:TldD/PmbA family protein [Nitrospirota bacterium]
MDPMTLTDEIIKKALKKGCDSAEVFIKSAEGISVSAKDGEIEALEASCEIGIALRVIKGNRPGFSFTTSHAEDDIENTIAEAVEGSRWTVADIYIDLPAQMKPSEVMVFDGKIKELREEDIIKHALSLEEKTRAYDSRITKVRKAEVSAGTGITTILNSKGVKASYASSYVSASVTPLAEDGNDSQIGWGFASSRRISGIDLDNIAASASKRAVELLGSRKIKPLKSPVILDPYVAVQFLGIVSASLSAEAVQKKRSLLAGRTGQTIVSPLIEIIDDGLMPWGTGTKPVDDEGVSVSCKTLVSKGVLTGYLHNTYTAKKDGIVSTGNAVRSSSKSLPGVGATNLYIKPAGSQESVSSGDPTRREVRGQKSEEKNELIRSLSRGILITEVMGVHTANPVSGDFSVGISGLWIENGEALYPVKEAVISGNILELFKKVEIVGSDLTFYGGKGSPSILIGEMDISA